jgi:NAD(P)-dependent dehydrogenase (short-subunit alcohol dehydrogenase family)
MNMKRVIAKAIRALKQKTLIPITEVRYPQSLLRNKVAMVIGATGGIGMAVCKAFLESGCRIVACGSNTTKLERMRSLFASEARISFLEFDVTDFGKYQLLTARAKEIYGAIDILVYSAGVHTQNADFKSMSVIEYDRVMTINLKGMYFVTQAVAKQMIEGKSGGKIILVSSSRGSEPAWSPYGLSKCALDGFTKGMAKELLKYNIIVNSIAPGSTATNLLGFHEGDSVYTNENPKERYILPIEVGNLAVFLASDAGTMIIGETVRISGGRGTFDIR